MFDIFFSYRHADAIEARAVVQALRDAELNVWFDESEMEAFASIQRGIEQGLDRAKLLMAWYSARYPQSPACQWELTRAFTAAQREGDARRRVLLVNPEPGNEHIHPIELRDALYAYVRRDASSLRKLVDDVVTHLGKLTGTFDTIAQGAEPAWYGPVQGTGSNRFFGRLPEIWAIHSALWRAQAPIISNGEARPLARLVGVGGSGKSLTAETYGRRFGAAYPSGIFWLRAMGHDTAHAVTAEQREALRDSQLLDFALAHGVPATALNAAEVRAALARKLQAAGPYLWVVDDLPSGFSWQQAQSWFAPSANGHTLITTRSDAFDWAGDVVAIEALDAAAAYSLLTHARQPEYEAEREAARQLVNDLDGHPLALELAAVVARARGYPAFRQELATPTRDALDFAAELMQARGQALPHRDKANLNLSQTLLLSVDALPEAARDVLRVAAQLAPAPISNELLARTLADADGLEPNMARDRADLAMSAVAAQSLGRESVPGCVLVHTLVSRTMRFRDTDEARRAALHVCVAPALDALLGNDVMDVRLHAKLRDLIAHARAALAPALAAPASAPLAQAKLLDALYLYDAYHGNYPAALRSADALIEYSRAHAGPEHRATLGFLLYRGRMQRLSGDLNGALATNEQMFEIARRTLGERDPYTLTALSDKALVLANLGQTAPARALQESVLTLRTQALGEAHEDTLTAMNNLAATLATAGDFRSARPLQERVVALRRTVLGPQHAETLAAMDNLTVTLRALGDASGARGLEQAWDASPGQAPDEEHPDNLTVLHNRAAALHGEGKIAESRELMERVLWLRRSQLGDTHPDTLTTMNNLGSILIAHRDFNAAKTLLQQSLELNRATLGAEHPQTWQAAFRLFTASVNGGSGWDEVKPLILRDLAPLMAQAPAPLSEELQEIRVKALALQNAEHTPAPRKPWWKRLF
jgi:hypothetical protein